MTLDSKIQNRNLSGIFDIKVISDIYFNVTTVTFSNHNNLHMSYMPM